MRSSLFAALSLLAAPALAAPTPPASTLVNGFESPADLKDTVLNAAEIALVATDANKGVTQGQSALQIKFSPSEWPSVNFRPATPFDWRSQHFAFDLFNPGATPVAFGLRADDDEKADGWNHSRTSYATLAPGERASFVMSFGVDPMSVGMRGLPPVSAPDGRAIPSQGAGEFNAQNIVTWQIFMHQPTQTQTLLLDNARLLPATNANLTGIVDAFGQYTRAAWPGKVLRAEELPTRALAEAKLLAQSPQLPNRDRFGGDASGPQNRASGFFRTEKRGERWHLVDPDGRDFFSLGADCVTPYFDTILDGRETMFSYLPADGAPEASFRSQAWQVIRGPQKDAKPKTFDFYRANLLRRYGADWQTAWRDTALRRLTSWGFNTVGAWSDEATRDPKAPVRVPYTHMIHIGGEHARVSNGDDYWGTMHDPFDPQFRTDVSNSLREPAAKSRDDAFCLGYFVDNELSWGNDGDAKSRYSLALGALHLNAATSPAKSAFLAQLRAKYKTIADLNASWQTQIASFDALDGDYRAPEKFSDGFTNDLQAFSKEFARQYFRVVSEELRKLDPNHLYLGCRLAWRTPEAVAASDEFCDVVSFNIYESKLGDNWNWTKTLSKPCIIGEFHFGARDRGMFHPGLVDAHSQDGRAEMFRDYVASVRALPNFVGCHWFQYVDEPLTGRSLDGENYNIGLVDTTDTPYPELVASAQSVARELYQPQKN